MTNHQGDSSQAKIIQLFDESSPELHRMLYRRLGSQQEAEDIAQDAFEKLCMIAQREDIDNLRKYFFTMASRLALNALRRRGVEHNYIRRTPPHQLNNEPDPQEVVNARQKLQLVKQALNRLPAKTLHVFLLHRFEGCTYKEIASQLGLSKKAIEYHISRALTVVMAAAERDVND